MDYLGFVRYLTCSVLQRYMGAEIHKVYGSLLELRTRPSVHLPISAVVSFSFIVRYTNVQVYQVWLALT